MGTGGGNRFVVGVTSNVVGVSAVISIIRSVDSVPVKKGHRDVASAGCG